MASRITPRSPLGEAQHTLGRGVVNALLPGLLSFTAHDPEATDSRGLRHPSST